VRTTHLAPSMRRMGKFQLKGILRSASECIMQSGFQPRVLQTLRPKIESRPRPIAFARFVGHGELATSALKFFDSGGQAAS